MRLIDAENVLKALGIFNDREHGDPHFLNGIETAREIVEQAPTVDAAPVVRCRSCRHYNTECCCEGFGWCHRRDFGTYDEWYCADGEAGTYADD